MKAIQAYLTFGGNCREAMTFYQECLNGVLTFQTIGDSPLCDQMPESMKECILHATLTNGNMVLLGSDMAAEKGLVRGNTMAMMLDCSSEEEIRSCYNNLSAGGEPTHELELTFWGAWFGDLTDKFGNQWLLHYAPDK